MKKLGNFLKFWLNVHHSINQDTSRFEIYQIVEYFPTDLAKLRKEIYRFDPSDVQYIMYNVLLGLAYIHSLGIVHRDISPDNIFVNWDDDRSKRRIVISDFGQARFYREYTTEPERFAIDDAAQSLTNPRVLGKINFRPPEGLGYYLTSHYDQSWDIWQTGLVFLNMICKNRHPFALMDHDYRMLLRRPIGDQISPDAFMLALIEKAFGYPTKSELADIVYFYPFPDGMTHQNIDLHRLTPNQRTQYHRRQQLHSNLLTAFQTTGCVFLRNRKWIQIFRHLIFECLVKNNTK